MDNTAYSYWQDEIGNKSIAEREVGMKLEAHQLWLAVDSVKRFRIYIENILDDKFIPDISHGINMLNTTLSRLSIDKSS